MNTSKRNYSLMNHHVEPPWRTPVTKEWSNEKKDEKSKVEALQWLDEALRWDKEKTWNSGKERWTNGNTNLMSLQNRELNSLNETRIRNALCLSFTNLIDDKQWIWHTTYSRCNGLKRDIAWTWEGLQRSTGRIWKARMHRYDTRRKKNSWTNHRKNWKQLKKR